MKTRFIGFVILILLTVQTGFGQEVFRIDNSKSVMKITGTSNVHDWEMSASGMSVTMALVKESSQLKNISAVEFTLPSKNIQSHNSIMDKKTWDAIKADKYSSIKFNLANVSGLSISGNQIKGTASGTLTIAGKSNIVSIPFTGEINSSQEIKIAGSREIRLKDFNVDPPTAMMGTLKTGETVTIEFDLQFVSTT